MRRYLALAGSLLSLSVFLNTSERSVAAANASASILGVETVIQLLTVEQIEPLDEAVNAAAFSRTRLKQRRAIRLTARVSASAPVAPKYLPAIEKGDASEHHKKIVNEVLMALPPTCRDTLKHFYVRYEKQQHRGLAGKSVMILDGTVKSDDEFRGLFIHESGHNWDLGCITGSEASGRSQFSDGDEVVYRDDPSVSFYEISWISSTVRRADSANEDFASGYASYDVFEDFSETFAYFILQNAEFAKRAETNKALAKKYAWMLNTIFDGTVPSIATGKSVYKGTVPWDVTKLSYSWQG